MRPDAFISAMLFRSAFVICCAKHSYSRPARPKSENRFGCRTILAAVVCRSAGSGPRVPGGHRCVASITTSGVSLKETVTVILVRGRARPLRESAREQLCCSVCKARRGPSLAGCISAKWRKVERVA